MLSRFQETASHVGPSITINVNSPPQLDSVNSPHTIISSEVVSPATLDASGKILSALDNTSPESNISHRKRSQSEIVYVKNKKSEQEVHKIKTLYFVLYI